VIFSKIIIIVDHGHEKAIFQLIRNVIFKTRLSFQCIDRQILIFTKGYLLILYFKKVVSINDVKERRLFYLKFLPNSNNSPLKKMQSILK